ncbi:hypothetical protein G6F60_014278 [Rhizopus arrhizus]|nr:hypothetical protein G6F60_014278 [Rhizopus arrhizus]
MDTDSSTESEESYSEEEDAEKEEEQSLLVLDDDQGEKVDIILEKETYHIKASSTGLTIHANTSKTITIDKPMEERNNHVYLFDVTHPTLLPAQGYFDPCTSLGLIVPLLPSDFKISNFLIRKSPFLGISLWISIKYNYIMHVIVQIG